MSEQEFIPAGEQSTQEKRENMSQAERAVHDFAEGMERHLDEEIANNDIANEKVKEEFVKPIDINLLAEQFDSIIEQSRECSNDIADTIHIKDLGEDSTKMLEDTISDLSKLHSQKSLPERLVGYVPNVLGARNKLESALEITERQVKRNQTVREFATMHFKQLEEKQEFVDNNRVSVDKIKQKLEDSSLLLKNMMDQTKGSLEYMKRNEVRDKGAEIKSKQLISRIGTQLISQRELIEQTEIYESIASVVSDHINAALPQIQNQFIDQVSVTSSLRNLKDLQDSVKSTQDLIQNLKGEGLKEMDQILDSYEKEGLGESKKTRELRETHYKKMESLREKRDRIERDFVNQLDKDIDKNMEVLERSNRKN